eukprot:1193944-Prorocentrum_minimum.AAC.5
MLWVTVWTLRAIGWMLWVTVRTLRATGRLVHLHVVDHAVEEAPRHPPVVVGAEREEAVGRGPRLCAKALCGLVVHKEVALTGGRPRQGHHVPLVDSRHLLLEQQEKKTYE